ncbi:MAG: Hpt domain-containing protein [Thermomonas sp.]|uniref:Hpt domain-containing protein n=1 Tax=Thermomonas sp. TaxID=1971895 RepID=UPI00262060DE|nr:Hpt domain-containing protein [Thermomonas sp.]MCC7096697.1 Hpt domain-containing protein [Thermomonas sp.]
MTAGVDPEMREVFIAELAEIIQNVDKALVAWRTDYANPTYTRALTRAFHTLKGSAPVVGATLLAELGLAAEQTAKRAGRKRNPDMTQIEAIEAAVALLPQWLRAMQNNLPAPESTRNVISALKRSAN